MSHRLITAAAALAAATILGVAVGYGAYAIADDEPEATRAPATATPTAAVASTTAVQTVYERAAAGVVEVATSATAEDAPFGGGRQRGVGSGFVYDDDGHVVTNHHVVEGAETVNVTFSDGSRSRATVVGSDPTTDLAVLEVEGGTGDRRPLGLAPEGSIEVGELAVAIGSPYGFDGTVTAGIVSALDRDIPSPNGFTISGAIQTDASINQGNSGGPLLDAEARVIGVNAQIESDTGGNVGLGFAIPSETVREVASELIADGEVEHAYLGVQITSLPAAVSQELGGPERPTVEVTRVVEAGPAARAGLRGADDTVTVDGEEYPAGGDLIVEVGGEPVQTAADLQAAISSRQPGTEVELTIVRDGSEQTLTVELGEQPETSS